jgi:hypothetical protein
VGRTFWAVVGISLGLTGLALAVPLPFVGIVVVVALGVVGAVCVAWSDHLLSGYANDLAGVREGTAEDGFVRAEAATPVGLDRESRASRSPSPHSRRRPAGPREDAGDAPLPSSSDSDQV